MIVVVESTVPNFKRYAPIKFKASTRCWCAGSFTCQCNVSDNFVFPGIQGILVSTYHLPFLLRKIELTFMLPRGLTQKSLDKCPITVHCLSQYTTALPEAHLQIELKSIYSFRKYVNYNHPMKAYFEIALVEAY